MCKLINPSCYRTTSRVARYEMKIERLTVELFTTPLVNSLMEIPSKVQYPKHYPKHYEKNRELHTVDDRYLLNKTMMVDLGESVLNLKTSSRDSIGVQKQVELFNKKILDNFKTLKPNSYGFDESLKVIENAVTILIDCKSKILISDDDQDFECLIEQLNDNSIIQLESFSKLGNTPFFRSALNTIYAEANEGKTYFVLDTLTSANIKKEDIYWLDADGNGELQDLFSDSTKHLPLENPTDYLEKITNIAHEAKQQDKYPLKNKVIIFDSFTNFVGNNNIDTNLGAKDAILGIKELVKYKATVIVIMHATKKTVQGLKTSSVLKLQGAESALKPHIDFLYQFKRDKKTNECTIIAQKARSKDIVVGEPILVGNQWLKDKIEDLINNNDDMSLRDLKAKIGSNYSTQIEDLKEVVFYTEKVKQDSGQNKQIVRLI